MTTIFRKAVSWAASGLALILISVGFSAFHARRICDSTIQPEIAPPPRYSTRFVLHPAKHMAGADELGFTPGWVVTYAPPSKTYGTAFFVDFLGKMLARGTPAIVTSEQVHAQAGLKRFEQAFAQADSAVAVGSRYSHALGILGTPIFSSTNSEGLIEAVFSYHPREMLLTRINWITNGFTLVVSNDVVIRKSYSYASNH